MEAATNGSANKGGGRGGGREKKERRGAWENDGNEHGGYPPENTNQGKNRLPAPPLPFLPPPPPSPPPFSALLWERVCAHRCARRAATRGALAGAQRRKSWALQSPLRVLADRRPAVAAASLRLHDSATGGRATPRGPPPTPCAAPLRPTQRQSTAADRGAARRAPPHARPHARRTTPMGVAFAHIGVGRVVILRRDRRQIQRRIQRRRSERRRGGHGDARTGYGDEAQRLGETARLEPRVACEN